MTDAPPPPRIQRVRVTNPLTTASTRQERSVRQEIDESTGVGEVYVRSLVSSQLRAAITVVISLVLTIGMLPLALVWLPGLADVRIVGLPLVWIVLALLVYPGIWTLAWLYVRQSERAESDFTALAEPGRSDAARSRGGDR